MLQHFHRYDIESQISLFHTHKIIGYTQKTIGLQGIHFHTFYGICSSNNHYHNFHGITSMPIKTNFGHIHKIDIYTDYSNNSQHRHKISCFTHENISIEPNISLDYKYNIILNDC